MTRMTIAKRLFAVFAVLAFVSAIWLWFVLLSPWGFSLPAGSAMPHAEAPHRVFVYGTLRWRPVRWAVLGQDVPVELSSLPGYRKQGLDVQPSSGDVVQGEVLVVDAQALRRLDRYERLGVRYERVAKTLSDGSRAWVYQRIEGN